MELIPATSFVIEFLRVDIIISFGFYSILFFIYRRFNTKSNWLNDFDSAACFLTVNAGLLYGLLWLMVRLWMFWSLNGELQLEFMHRYGGPYWYAYWTQPLFWTALSQLLRIGSLKRSLVFRLVFSLAFLLSFERLIMVITSLHRDYLPSSWTFDIPTLDIVVGIFLKTSMFVLLTAVIYWVRNNKSAANSH